MGKILKNLVKKNIMGSRFEVELNKEPSEKSKKIIHISMNQLRIELTQKEFFDVASTFILAEKNLKNLKKIK